MSFAELWTKINVQLPITIITTVLSGVAVFIISQYFLELVLKPHKEFLLVIYKIDNRLKYLANVVSGFSYFSIVEDDSTAAKKLIKKIEEASDELRRLSCDLESTYKSLQGFMRGSRSIRGITNADVSKAGNGLILLSNIIIAPAIEADITDAEDRVHKTVNEIRQLLHIPSL